MFEDIRAESDRLNTEKEIPQQDCLELQEQSKELKPEVFPFRTLLMEDLTTTRENVKRDRGYTDREGQME